MKTIIAGGRDYKFTGDDILFLETLEITEVVSGGAEGADKEGETYATSHGMVPRVFEADWDDLSEPCVLKHTKYGKPYNAIAGHNRNKKMAEYADAVVLFAGGKGTADMFRQAMEQCLIIHDRRNV